MRYLVTADEMRRLDQYTIEEIGIPAAVLMERGMVWAAEGREYAKKHNLTTERFENTAKMY